MGTESSAAAVHVVFCHSTSNALSRVLSDVMGLEFQMQKST